MNDSTAKLHKDSVPEIVPAKQEASTRKEQSVLQTKLTKLAIQIGYAGNNFSFVILSMVTSVFGVLCKNVKKTKSKNTEKF